VPRFEVDFPLDRRKARCKAASIFSTVRTDKRVILGPRRDA
jgi:hypothetical protein